MLEKILDYAIPVFSIGLTYVLGRLQSIQSDKKSAYQEAYDTFYLPFISMLYESQIWRVGFSQLNFKMRQRLFSLIASNIKYMDKETIEYVDVLYAHYEAILGKELLFVNSVLTHDRMNELFDAFTLKVLSRSTWLAKRLHQPCIGEFVRELYREEREVQEI